MRDKLVDLITVGIARYHVKRANNEDSDMAAIIADVLIENDVCINQMPKFFWFDNGNEMPTREELMKAVEELGRYA